MMRVLTKSLSFCLVQIAEFEFYNMQVRWYTVDVYRYKTIESIGNSFVTFPKGISYIFYQYYL